MPSDPRIKALANEAAVKIKTLTDAHHQQIEAVYTEFRQKAAIVQESNADELDNPSVTPAQPTASDQRENHHDTE